MTKRLYKSETDRKLSGVCAGIAEYFDIDPTVVRVGYVFITFVSGIIPGAIAYFVLAALMPNKSEVENNGQEK